MASLISLIYYAAVSKNSVVMAEYVAQGNMDMPALAGHCLKYVPVLHSLYSHTTRLRRFVCIIDGIFTYCAIVDEALSKEDAFSYLQKNRDAFKTLCKGRGPESETGTSGAKFLDEDMGSIMRQHAIPFVGMSQRDKLQMEAEHQAEQDADNCPQLHSPTTVGSPLDEEFQGFCCWHVGRWLKFLCENK